MLKTLLMLVSKTTKAIFFFSCITWIWPISYGNTSIPTFSRRISMFQYLHFERLSPRFEIITKQWETWKKKLKDHSCNFKLTWSLMAPVYRTNWRMEQVREGAVFYPVQDHVRTLGVTKREEVPISHSGLRKEPTSQDREDAVLYPAQVYVRTLRVKILLLSDS